MGHILDPATGEPLDEVVLTFFKAPHSYTGQDVVELSCHGSPVILRRVLEIVVEAGARIAEPGEFTLRAFFNRRIDLAQAQAVETLSTRRPITRPDSPRASLKARCRAASRRSRICSSK